MAYRHRSNLHMDKRNGGYSSIEVLWRYCGGIVMEGESMDERMVCRSVSGSVWRVELVVVGVLVYYMMTLYF